LAIFQMAPMPSSLISSGSKKKEPTYACWSEVKASHSHKMWTEVSSSVHHFLQMGSLHNPMICNCLLKVLCPVSRPLTTLDCVLLKDYSRARIARSGPEINSRACLCVLQGSHNNATCCFSIQLYPHPIHIHQQIINTYSYTTEKTLHLLGLATNHFQDCKDIHTTQIHLLAN